MECRYLRPNRSPGQEPAHFCHYIDAALSDAELRIDYADMEPAAAELCPSIWNAPVEGTSLDIEAPVSRPEGAHPVNPTSTRRTPDMISRSHALAPIALTCTLLAGCSSTQSATVQTSAGESRPASQDSPVLTEAQFQELQKSLLFTADDVRYLQMSRSVLEPNVEELLDVWYGFVGSNPHLLYYFSHPVTKEPDMEYLSKVRVRFHDWGCKRWPST